MHYMKYILIISFVVGNNHSMEETTEMDVLDEKTSNGNAADASLSMSTLRLDESKKVVVEKKDNIPHTPEDGLFKILQDLSEIERKTILESYKQLVKHGLNDSNDRKSYQIIWLYNALSKVAPVCKKAIIKNISSCLPTDSLKISETFRWCIIKQGDNIKIFDIAGNAGTQLHLDCDANGEKIFSFNFLFENGTITAMPSKVDSHKKIKPKKTSVDKDTAQEKNFTTKFGAYEIESYQSHDNESRTLSNPSKQQLLLRFNIDKDNNRYFVTKKIDISRPIKRDELFEEKDEQEEDGVLMMLKSRHPTKLNWITNQTDKIICLYNDKGQLEKMECLGWHDFDEKIKGTEFIK